MKGKNVDFNNIKCSAVINYVYKANTLNCSLAGKCCKKTQWFDILIHFIKQGCSVVPSCYAEMALISKIAENYF